MSRSVAIVDYGVGNLRSVARAVAACDAEPRLVTAADEVAAAEIMILPGVGAFGGCVKALEAHGLKEPVREVISAGRPVLGICVGMQMLLDESEEFGRHAGFGFVPGTVRAIPGVDAEGRRHKIPHVGWNGLQPGGAGWHRSIMQGIAPGEACYFVHSFAAVPEREEDCLAMCEYGGVAICAAVARGNLVGVQFHPEKSGPVGLRILGNFINGA